MDASLKNVIAKLRDELVAADEERRSANREAILTLREVVIELHVTVSEARERSGGIDVKVVSLGMGSDRRTEEIQKITVRLGAVDGSTGDEDGEGERTPAGTRFRRAGKGPDAGDGDIQPL